MPRKIIYMATALSVVAISLLGCMSTSRFFRNAHLNISRIAPDFNPQKHVLLVAEMPKRNDPDSRHNGITNKLNKSLKKSFPYPYQIASKKQIMDSFGKYNDTTIYRFALLNTLSFSTNTTRTTFYGSNGRSTSVSPSAATTTTIDFAFYDRVSQQQYQPTGGGAAFIKYPVAVVTEMMNQAIATRTKK